MPAQASEITIALVRVGPVADALVRATVGVTYTLSMKPRTKSRDKITLLEVLTDGFEKNEILYGYHTRVLPLPTEPDAIAKFGEFVDEVKRWQGEPKRSLEQTGRRLAAWSDLEIRQAGCGVMVRVSSAWFTDWWSDENVWAHDPLGDVYEWLAEDTKSAPL